MQGCLKDNETTNSTINSTIKSTVKAAGDIKTPLKITTKQDAQQWIEENSITHVKVAVFDLNGIMRGKCYLQKDLLAALITVVVCDVVLGSDYDDQICSGVQQTGWLQVSPTRNANSTRNGAAYSR